ncbi:MAG: FtsW/RodA/SpoVE family cell cycle protein [Chloroflexi bacterium]|nr:FtsW/RodA/SpoVE family cell cycle protein [Chloroflexota bacterium]
MTATTTPATPTRKKAGPLNLDWGLLLIVGVLLAFGLMMVYSTTFDWSYTDFKSPTTVFFRQVRSLAIGLVVMAALARLDYHHLRRAAVPLLGITILALIVVLVFGTFAFGAQRGLLNGSYQPSELAKLATVIYLSVWLTSKGEMIKDFGYGLAPYGVVVGVLAGLVLQEPDVSATLTIVLVGATMFFLAGADLLQIALASIVSGAAGYAVVMSSTTARDRIAEYLAGLTNIEQTSWHVQQAIIAFINGGVFGRGLGQSYQKFEALPTPHTDSVIINIGVMVAALPFAGNALPLISYGGSSLVVTLAGIGVLLSVSRHNPNETLQRKTRASFDYSRRDRRPRVSRPRSDE